MTDNRDVFINLDNSIQSEVKIGNDRRLLAKGCGDVLLTKKGAQKRTFNSLYVPVGVADGSGWAKRAKPYLLNGLDAPNPQLTLL